jgi:hypothetical protein
MAITAVSKRYTHVVRFFIRTRSVAAFAGNFGVQTRERISGSRMIELADIDRLPVDGVVTLQTVGPEPAIVLVLMAGNATGRDSEECPGQILDFDFRAFALGYAFRGVAPVTVQPCVFPLEGPSGLPVVETLTLPFCDREIFAIVLRVAGNAFQARSRFEVV